MEPERRGQRLRGRTAECEALRRLIATVQSAQGQVLVLRGEAGVGKTALLDFVAQQARGFRITPVAGVESDMELAYAGLQQLCAPLMNNLDDLPEPQRDALAVAFGLGVGQTPDRFLVGLAVLSLMAAAADEKPLLCLVDDAQWLDQVSVQTLAFVARRLLAEPVGLIFAVRDNGAPALAGLPELFVGGLSDTDARELLDAVVLGRLDERVRDRVVAETRGIPLALLEVPRNISAAELAGGFGTVGTRRSAGRVEDSFTHRIQALPADTQQLLLLAAAEPVGDAALFVRAAAHRGIPVPALAPAESAGLIEFGTRIRFHHPLVRSAAYRAASVEDRRAAHHCLAEATDAATDPDRRAWHAANAAAGPSDAVAAELEASASRAQMRGGIAAAATFLERAAVLSADLRLRGARAVAAAQAKRDAADPEAAYELLAIAELSPLSDLQRAQIARLRAQMEFSHSRRDDSGSAQLRDAAAMLLDAARRLENLDDDLALETYLEAIAATMYAGHLGEPDALVTTAEAAKAAVGRFASRDDPIALLLDGISKCLTGGVGGAAVPLRKALTLWCSAAQHGDGQVLPWIFVGYPIVQESAVGELWDDTLMEHLADAMVRYTRDAGALAALPAALSCRAGAHLLSGEFSTAGNLLDEANAIAVAINDQPLRYHRLHLAAWRGSTADTVALIESATAMAHRNGEGRLLAVLGYFAALLYNGAGRYDEAFAAIQPACSTKNLGFGGWCLLELIEAAVHTGRRETAEDAVARLAAQAGASGTDWGLGALAGARAMLADNDTADALFTEAIERLQRTRVVVQLARTHLRYGEWLRRVNRRSDARRHLGVAFDMFTRMGAAGFAERARRELTATGEKVRKQPVNSGDELTAQEAQIARLAADGLTNQEIGSQLFISTHTVEWHLRKVFVKLGIGSRRQLRTIDWAD
ncbi:AAA family ATPase [Mycolicibacterium goodii]|uniref:helix-turn-helix transcriptional regulator n=1 Tax=Mycolicibacterium goodii TaxID=134601 RepID=UPI001BDD1A7F|nr:LuxR family transcriptional regulator [Mycolicibacterium goodii]MBU8812850.1 AAA family ATPase [Mycolicibacterium goodii]ULN48114.1 AAA family ATPase [Mycolicibacterium goodii]